MKLSRTNETERKHVWESIWKTLNASAPADEEVVKKICINQEYESSLWVWAVTWNQLCLHLSLFLHVGARSSTSSVRLGYSGGVFGRLEGMMSPIWVLWLLIYMRAFYFWLTHLLYDLPLMTMLYFSGVQKRKDESDDFNCNNVQTFNVLCNTSGITELVNDSHPLW